MRVEAREIFLCFISQELRVVLITVIPTKVGIQNPHWQWIPASAGMTKLGFLEPPLKT
jgi:hypothetical protein